MSVRSIRHQLNAIVVIIALFLGVMYFGYITKEIGEYGHLEAAAKLRAYGEIISKPGFECKVDEAESWLEVTESQEEILLGYNRLLNYFVNMTYFVGALVIVWLSVLSFMLRRNMDKL